MGRVFAFRPFSLAVAMLLAVWCGSADASSRYLDWENWMSSATAVVPGRAIKGPWQLNVGFGAAYAPEYFGSDSFEMKPLPLVDIEYKNRLYASTQRGFGYNIWHGRTVRAGPRITWDFGRDSAVDQRLATLPDIDPSLEVGFAFEGYLAAWRFRADIRKGVSTGHEGLLMNADVAWGSRWSKRSSIIVGARTTYMGSNYADAYFSVNAANATAGLPAYNAGSGLRDLTGYAQIVFDVTKELYVSVEGRGTMLLSEADDSPISETSNFFVGSAMVGYRF